MQNRKIAYWILAALFALALILHFASAALIGSSLKVVFFDVGQGDSILISQGSNQILIDGGKSGQIVLEKLGKHVPFWDRKIETVIITHPDQDHIGGLVSVFDNYNVQTVLKTNARSDSKTFEVLEQAIAMERSEVIEAKAALSIIFPKGARMEIKYPFSVVDEKISDTNETSVVALLDAGKTKFLFTGDLPSEKEAELISGGVDIKADILKVGHHGSKYSSSDIFLDSILAKEVVISVGKGNTYGHPNAETLERLFARKVNILRTDESGDIIYDCLDMNTGCVRRAF